MKFLELSGNGSLNSIDSESHSGIVRNSDSQSTSLINDL
jgi:hypothetical protein